MVLSPRSQRRLRPSVAALLLALAIGFGAGVAEGDIVASIPGGGWAIQSTTAGGSVRLVEGPTTPPAGRGSLELGVTVGTDRALLHRTLPGGYRPWNGLGTATLSTYVTSPNQSAAPVLKFVGWHVISPTATQFTTLNFVPRDNGTVVQNAWQRWTMTPSSIVWQSNTSDGGFCTQASKCTLAAFMARYPNGGWYGEQVAVGTGIPTAVRSYVDDVTVTDRGEQFNADFEPVTAQASTATIEDVQWSGAGSGTVDVVLNSGSVAISPVVYDIAVGSTTHQVTVAAGGTQHTETLPVPAATTGIIVRTNGIVLDSVATPGPPTQLSATPNGPGSVSVGWTPPSGRVDSYWLRVTPGSVLPCAANPCDVTGLQPGTLYTFQVNGVTAGLQGAQSNAATATALAAPTAPGKPAATVAGHRSLSVAWSGPTSTVSAPVSSYQVEMATGSGGFAPVGSGACAVPAASPCTVPGLTVGTAYRFRVAAVNLAGTGAWSSESDATSAVAVVPPEPTGVAATPGDTTATIHWTVPTNTTNLTGYTATAEPGQLSCDASGATATTCQISGLTNGQPYTVTVVSRGSMVDSSASAPVSVVPSQAPGQPTGVTALAGVSSIAVQWSAPNPGSGIAGYTVTASPGSARCETTGTSCVLGAVAGVATTVTVVARGVHGRDSMSSAQSNSVVPAAPAVPAAPPSVRGGLTAEPALTVVAPGQQLALRGAGFAPHSTVRILIFSTPTDLASVTADSNGEILADVTVPAEFSGRHTFVALGVDSSGRTHTPNLPITVRATSLAATGTPVLQMTLLGLGSTVLGALVLLLAGGPRAPRGSRHRYRRGARRNRAKRTIDPHDSGVIGRRPAGRPNSV